MNNIKECFHIAMNIHGVSAMEAARALKVTTPYLISVMDSDSKSSVSELDRVAQSFGYKLHNFLRLNKYLKGAKQ